MLESHAPVERSLQAMLVAPSGAAVLRWGAAARLLAIFHGVAPALTGLALLAALATIPLGPRYGTGAAVAVGSGAVLVVFFGRFRRLPRAGMVAAVHALSWAFIVFHASMRTLDLPFVGLRPLAEQEGIGDHGVPTVVAWVVLSSMLMGVHLVAADRPHVRAFLDSWLGRFAVSATVVVIASAGIAFVRGGQPEPDAFLGRFDKLGELRPGEVSQFRGMQLVFTSPSATPGELGGCTVHTFFDVEPSPSTDCGVVTVSVDPWRQYLLVERASGVKDVFEIASWHRVPLRPANVAGQLSPPVAWTAGAGIAALLAVGMLALALHARQRRDDVLAGSAGSVEGVHLGDGVVELADRRSAEVATALAARLPRGPVVVRGPSTVGASYREAETVRFAEAEAGTLEELHARAHEEMTSFVGLAAAVACLGLAPLAACWATGMF